MNTLHAWAKTAVMGQLWLLVLKFLMAVYAVHREEKTKGAEEGREVIISFSVIHI